MFIIPMLVIRCVSAICMRDPKRLMCFICMRINGCKTKRTPIRSTWIRRRFLRERRLATKFSMADPETGISRWVIPSFTVICIRTSHKVCGSYGAVMMSLKMEQKVCLMPANPSVNRIIRVCVTCPMQKLPTAHPILLSYLCQGHPCRPCRVSGAPSPRG